MNQEERQKWLAERKSGIGGSDAGAILGVSPWATAVTVWLDKTGRSAPKPENEAMRIGTELEDFVARRYEQETGRSVQRYNKMIHKGCLLGNYDRLVIPEGGKTASHQGEVRTDLLLECKTSSAFGWDEGVPPTYYAQVMHYMGLTPCLRHADVACLFLVAKQFKVFRVERDDAVIAAMQEKLTDWWERYVVADVPPPPVSEDDCRLLWAKSNPGKSITASEDIERQLAEYSEAEAKIKELKAESQKAKDSICAFMQDAEVLVGVDGKPLLTWKSASDSVRTDWEKLARSLGATDEQIVANSTTTPGSRRFTPKKPKAA